MNNELAYWITLAHLPKIKTSIKNEIIVRLFEQNKTIIDFFNLTEEDWKNKFNLSDNDISIIKSGIEDLPNNSFLVESLLEQGYKILPITSPEYSSLLKKNLGKSYAPPILYTKGNLQILKEDTIAIVGSRKANEFSLLFTDNIAKKASENYKVVVSGFAKGVDKQALDSALKYKGHSIIVLPQGITTFKSGFKKYYKQIIEGDVLVLSTFHPKAVWSVQLAMARNPIIYGLAKEIYVAESSSKGGTWSGVIDGLRKKRIIYVRKPDINEKNANILLIQKGAKPVDITGNIIEYMSIDEEVTSIVSEQKSNYYEIESKILDLLKKGIYTSKKIVEILKIDWNPRKVTNFLKNQKDVVTINKKPLKFTHISRQISPKQQSLFDLNTGPKT
ncbi:MAG: DNA-protecting protein DprA [Bacteroidales bacterium]|nr:DNA-protecting protein DprA [Bacteroidales bacterium]